MESVLNQFLVQCLGYHISEERNKFVAENFIQSLVSKYGKYTVYTDGGHIMCFVYATF